MKRAITLTAIVLMAVFSLWYYYSGPEPHENATSSTTTHALGSEYGDGTERAGQPSQTGKSQGDAFGPNAEDGLLQRSTLARRLQFLDPDGSLLKVPVEFFLVKVNEELKSRMSTFARVGQSLWGNATVFEDFNESSPGSVTIPANTPVADFVLVFAEGYAPYLNTWEAPSPGQTLDIALDSVDSIKVKVVDPNGNPLKGAQAWITYGGTFNHGNTGGLLPLLKQRFFQQGYETDENGEVTISTCFEGPHNEVLFIPGALWGRETLVAKSGDSLKYVALPGFVIRGKITLNHKTPDREIHVNVMDRYRGGFSQLSSTRAQEDGSYTIEGILVVPDALDISATGEGIAMNIHTIVNPPANGVIPLDIDLSLGKGGSLRLTTPWGSPIVDGKVVLRRSKEQNTPYAYRTDQDGLLVFPNTLPMDESFRFSVEIGNIKVRPSQLFFAGSDLEVIVPNLATISKVEIDQNLLGDATLSNLYWIPSNAASEGYAEWQGTEKTSPLLAAGHGSLRIGVSDGRWFGKSLFLETGKNQSINLGLTPSTILCDVGPNPTRVRLVSTDGAFAYEAKELRGAIEIPCWEGTFSLHAWWEGQAMTIPPFQVKAPIWDLGALQGSQLHTLQGTVTFSDGRPAEYAKVGFFGLYGADGRETYSDENGKFTLTDIQEGQHHLNCSAPSLGSLSTNVISTVIVSHGLPTSPLNIVLPLSASEGEVSGLANHYATSANVGFLISSGILQSKEIPASQTYSFSASATESWLGEFHTDSTHTFAFAQKIQPGPGSYDLSSMTGAEYSLTLVDEFQRPRRDLIIRLQLEGVDMPLRITLGQNASHRFSLYPSLPWTLSVRTQTGYERKLALSMLNGQPIVIPRNESMRLVHALSQDGSSIARFSVQSADGGLFFGCQKQGEVQIPTSCTADLFAAAPGKLACWIEGSSASETVVLPNAVTGVSVELGASMQGATSLQWRSDIDCNSIWGVDGVEAIATGPTVNLPPLPEGGLELKALDASGTVLVSKRWDSVASGQKILLSD